MIVNAERVARELRLLLKKRDTKLSATVEQALEPFVTFALAQLQNRASPGTKRMIAASAWRNLAHALKKRLLFALGPTLRIEQIANEAIARGSRKRSGISLNEAIRSFPGLLETAAQLVSGWIHAQRELSDLHRENWIAVGAQPILLDAELIGSDESRQRRTRSKDRQWRLLQTGLIPLTRRDRAGFYTEIAPLDATLAGNILCWASHNGNPVPPFLHLDELVRGFQTVAAIFADRQSARNFYEQIISAAGRTRQTRILFRPSAEYARMSVESLMPDRMSSRNKRPRWLAQKCSASAATSAVAVTEARALFNCDIPKFSVRRGGATISRKEFSVAIAQLQGSARLLRTRVLLGAERKKS